ncbi:PQQ-binding-like beta-propeller repeat protein [Mangrovivirga cuniculi]|uniref:PQQ-like domain-containing protein n=1 Tax=Mangrovivirga cuniculi TaxID=2715131 RepID=A0A4D7JHY5_9BACT|nr:PQQ-binding-like beta-propeller repeat protein [Mangrovivirga cuniculi]QCK15619.1 hypothetical protein DCC35_13125 [Mangrovivirga cuniculi]
MKYIYIFIFLILNQGLTAQEFVKVYEHNIDRPLGTLINGELTDFEISPSGDYVMMLTSEYVKTLNRDGDVIFEYRCVPKTNTGSSVLSNVIGGEVGKMISNIKLDEGNGFWLYEDENLMLVLDWNLEQNLVMAFDLATGEKLWETDDYRYTPGQDKQLAAIMAATAVSAVASQSYSMGAIMADATFTSIHTDMTSREGIGSKRAMAFITPLPGTNDFLLTNKDGITSINKKTGQKNWTYDKRPLKIGEAKVISQHDEILLVNNNPAFLTNSELNYNPNYFIKQGYVVRLDINTGEEKAKVDFKGSFKPGRVYVLKDIYILDYFGPEAYDLETNELIYEAISKEEYAEDKTVKTVKLEKDWINPSKSVYDGERIYYVRSDFTTVKKRIMGHDIKTGEKLWQTDEMDKTTGIVDQTEGGLLIKEFGIGKNFFTKIDKSTGEILAGPVKIKQPVLIDDRKPWLFTTENHIVHNGTRLYFLDKETLKEEKDVKLKKAKIGDVYAMDLLPTGFVMVGEKGVAFYDRQGNFESNIKINNVERGLWTDNYMLAITEGNIIRSGDIHMISIDNQKEVDEMRVSDLTVFSPNLNHVIRANNKLDSRLEFYSIK